MRSISRSIGRHTGGRLPILTVEADAKPSRVARFQVLSTPTWILLVDGKEKVRVAGRTSFECSLDTLACAACSSPTSYTDLGEGSHTFRVRATDRAGNTDPTPAEQSWSVQANTPPLARFTFSCSALTCSFDGSGSTDSDGWIASYAWDFGDGASGSGVTASHTYGGATRYTVTLTVTDDRGATASDSKAVYPIALSAVATSSTACRRPTSPGPGRAGRASTSTAIGQDRDDRGYLLHGQHQQGGPGSYTYQGVRSCDG